MAVEFSIEELRGILLAAGLDPALAASLQATLEGDGVGDALEEFLVTQLQGKVSQLAIDAALEGARRQARKITGDLLQSELNKIAQKVADNIAAGKSPLELARLLDEIKGLDSNRAATYEKYKALLDELDLSRDEYERKLERMYQKLLRERKKTIAATEQRMATSAKNKAIAESRGQQWKRWLTVGDNRVSDMDQANEREGWIPIDQEFDSGHQQPPSHPNCRCTVVYRTSAPDEAAEQRVREKVERTATAKGE